MSKRPEFLGIKQLNKQKRLEWVVVLLIVFCAGLFALKLWNDSKCTSWLTSAEGTKVACVGTLADDAKNADEKGRRTPK
jgi:uncharacterized membrane-anchored protein YjiN (DUF445 family)